MNGNVRSNDDTLVARRLAARFEARSTSREPEGLLDAAMPGSPRRVSVRAGSSPKGGSR